MGLSSRACVRCLQLPLPRAKAIDRAKVCPGAENPGGGPFVEPVIRRPRASLHWPSAFGPLLTYRHHPLERSGTAVRRTLVSFCHLIDAHRPMRTPGQNGWSFCVRRSDDGVDYLAPISDRFGEIAAFPGFDNLHADVISISSRPHGPITYVTPHVPTAP